MSTISLPKIAAAALLAVLALGLSAPCAAQSYKYEWGRRLMEDYRFDDMAEKVFQDMTKGSDRDEKIWGRKGLADLKRRQALRADDFKVRDALNEESLEMLREVTKSLPRNTPQYFDVLFELSENLLTIVNEDIGLIEEGKVPNDLYEETVKRDENRLNEAEQIFVRAQGSFDPNSPDENIQNLIKEGSLNQQRVRLLRAELIGTDRKLLLSPNRKTILIEARDGLEDFGILNEGTGWGYLAYLWMGRVQAALYESKEPGIEPRAVIGNYDAVFRDMTSGEELDAYRVRMASIAYNWGFQFLGRHGLSEEIIKRGEEMVKLFKERGLEYEFNGQMALIQLARAYQDAGRGEGALKIAAKVSDMGGYPGLEADKIMSLVIRTALNKEQFKPAELAAGANGAFLAARRNPEKYKEAIELYQNVVANLDQLTDAVEREKLGRLALYRMGVAYDELGFDMESYVALEECYKRFNTENVPADNKDFNSKVERYWRAVAGDIVRSSNGAKYAKSLEQEAQSWIIAHPPKGSTEGVVALKWRAAENARRQRDYPKAIKLYKEIATNPSEYQERAMVKAAVCGVYLLKDQGEGTQTAEAWVTAAKEFEDYIAYTKANPTEEEAKIEARKTALVEAWFQISECYNEAAQLEQDLAKKKSYLQKIEPAVTQVISKSGDENVEQHARYNLLGVLIDLGSKDVERVKSLFNAMYEADPNHKLMLTAAIKTAKYLDGAADSMPADTSEQIAARDELLYESAKMWRVWVEKKNPKKAASWYYVLKKFDDLDKHAEAKEVAEKALQRVGGKKSDKYTRYFERSLASSTLYMAKEAYRHGHEEEATQLFEQAAPVYKDLVGADNNGTNDVLQQAAQVFGGFLVGPDRFGNYKYIKGNADFQRATEIWKKLQYRFKREASGAKTSAERDKALQDYEEARLYTFLTYYAYAKSKDDLAALRKLDEQVSAVFIRANGSPGGAGSKLLPMWKWLKDEL